MIMTWYPVIDYMACIECGACVAKCSHGVYDAGKAPSPVVQNPQACVHHCHGCGEQCPVGAITYVGEDTGWKPPSGVPIAKEACCACGGEGSSGNKIVVAYFYLDLKICDRCIGTDKVLDEVMLVLTPALQLAGFEVTYNKIQIKSAELAKQYKLLTSPTIRINGKDLCQSVVETRCGCCSDISGADVECRVAVKDYSGKIVFNVPD
ncbi:MAG: DUF2703 domain-containing protein, partial [Clostridia bacterium]|nr:DUF2703 domain-containing protein [Clostridia bacterium]